MTIPPGAGPTVTPDAYQMRQAPREVARQHATSAPPERTPHPSRYVLQYSKAPASKARARQKEPPAMAEAEAQIGVTGLGVMGRNLARTFARHG